MNGIKLPFTLSLAGHAICLVLLALFLSAKPPVLREPIAKGGIEVVFEAALPKQEATPAPPEPPPPQAETTPPSPELETPPPQPEPPPVAASEPPPEPEAPAAAGEPLPAPPPVPQKHVVKRPPKHAARHSEAPQPSQAYFPSPPQLPATPAPAAAPQTAMAPAPLPAPLPSPEASTGYRALLSAWLESHKRYPDTARQRGEEGRAVLRFSVDRSGRVIDFAVTSSSGYPDLDRSIEEMMRGASLPPFPAGMPQPRMDVSVTIRFSLR